MPHKNNLFFAEHCKKNLFKELENTRWIPSGVTKKVDTMLDNYKITIHGLLCEVHRLEEENKALNDKK